MFRFARPTAPLLAAVALALAVGPRSVIAQAPGEPRTVPAFVDAFVTAVRAWDADAWAALVTEDVVMMTPGGSVVEGRRAFRDLWTRTFEGRTGANPLHVEVRESVIVGDLAVVRADYGPTGRDPVGQYVWTLVRRPGGPWALDWWIFTREGGGR